MKKLTILFLGVILSTTCIGQILEDIEGKQCTQCNMPVKDPRFASIAQSASETHAFDAIECLVNFLKENDEHSFNSILVPDFSQGGQLIPAQTAVFLKSRAIPSPMGAYLSAYASKKIAQQVQSEKGGQLYNWTELQRLFKDSRFGLLDHPTHHHNNPGSYAPAGIMGDHLHHMGGLMVSLRYMDMHMKGNLEGSTEVSNTEIFESYMVAPQSMTMRMMMLGVMYAPSDRITFMLMQQFSENKMNLKTRMGNEFSTESRGMGDMKVSLLLGILSSNNHALHLNTTVNIPTGNLKKRDGTPMVENMKLPYLMQLGTGTVDLTVGGTYKGTSNRISWGLQPLATLRTGENSEGYRFGNQLDVNCWISYDVSKWIGISGRFNSTTLTQTIGQDEELNAMMAPPANTNNSGSTRIRSFIGTNFSFGDQPVLRNIKASTSFGLPIFQKVQGIQMAEVSSFHMGLTYSI